MARVKVGTENDTPVELTYSDQGTGRPVVLIHAWPLSARTWEKQIPALIEAGQRVITYDRRGFGDSSQPWTGYDYDTLTADLDVLLSYLDLRDVTLVGFSMGGGEVARYVARHGTERVTSAVFAAAIPPYLYQSEDNPAGGLDDATIRRFQDSISGDRIAFLEWMTGAFFAVGDRTDLISEPNRLYHRRIAEFASPKGTLDCVTAFGLTDLRGDLEKIDELGLPTLVIHGDSDAMLPFEISGKRTHESIKRSTLALIKGGPHGLNITHPEEFNRALVEFLRT